MSEPPFREEDVLAEKIEVVIDSEMNKVVDLIWTRVWNNEWRIFAEAYSAVPAAQAYRANHEDSSLPLGYARRVLMLEDALIARVLYEGLHKEILK